MAIRPSILEKNGRIEIEEQPALNSILVDLCVFQNQQYKEMVCIEGDNPF